MSYKTILVHTDQTSHAAARVKLAVRLALSCGAHLTGLACTGISRFAQAGDLMRQWPMLPEHVSAWRERARESLGTFGAIAQQGGLAMFTPCLADDDPEDALLLQAPFHDLLILSQTDPAEQAPGVIRDLPQNVLLHGGRPLLLVPGEIDGEPLEIPFRHPLLAWDGSGQAARAISNALPLLKMAGRATLVVLNVENLPAAHGMEPGADMALFLARHGVKVELMREYTRADIGDALLDVAADLGCDLLVMGGYGHRRVRENVLGGTTRTVLDSMSLPVLMAH
jgi:nucleotide-binding universal stress UspA family protein